MEPKTTGKDATLDLGHSFLKAFGQAVKLISLYKAGHPVPVSSVQQAWHHLQELFAETGWPEASFALSAGRWMLNDALLSDSASAFELPSLAFRSHAIQSVTFEPAVKLYEFSSLCEMAATPPNLAYQTDAADFLKERGVKNIRVNIEEFVRRRRVKPPASAVIQSPIAQARLQAASKPPTAASGDGPIQANQGFGAFIKSLVESAVSDPQERAKVYGEAVSMVQQALARHVSEATHRLLMEKQGVVNERMRAEHVLSRVAEGKVIVDQEGRVIMMDPAAEEVMGKPFADVAGKPILESLQSGERMVALAKELVVPENRPVSDQVRTAGADEVLNAFRQSMAMVHDEQGRVVGTYAVLPYVAKFRDAMKLQEDFMDNITHDLKAPLASICSALELINEKLASKLTEEEASFIDIGLRNSRLLRQMINELLDFSKIKSGRMAVKPEPTPPEDMLREAVDALKPWARSKKLSLKLEDGKQLKKLPQVLADKGRVVQILTNLISNSIKCTPEEGRIIVSAERGEKHLESWVVFSVRDTGCGISSADQKRVFEKFTQVTGDGRTREGVGLGLAIVKELISLHKGKIWVESEPGKGAAFFFCLPIAV